MLSSACGFSAGFAFATCCGAAFFVFFAGARREGLPAVGFRTPLRVGFPVLVPLFFAGALERVVVVFFEDVFFFLVAI